MQGGEAAQELIHDKGAGTGRTNTVSDPGATDRSAAAVTGDELDTAYPEGDALEKAEKQLDMEIARMKAEEKQVLSTDVQRPMPGTRGRPIPIISAYTTLVKLVDACSGGNLQKVMKYAKTFNERDNSKLRTTFEMSMTIVKLKLRSMTM
jgi:hypothetical protein